MGKEHVLGQWAASGCTASGADVEEAVRERGACGVRDVAARWRSGRKCLAEHMFESE
jgi:hypothetical protein